MSIVSLRRNRRRNLPLSAAILSGLCAATLLFAYFKAPPPSTGRDLLLQTTVRSAGGYPKNFCETDNPNTTPSNFLRSDNLAWLALLLPAIVSTFIGLAIITDDYFVPALGIISTRLNLSEDVAGATFMAAGSSAPELFTSMLSTFVGGDDLGVGTIVGSAVFNICVIIGLSALGAKSALDLDFRPFLRDAFFYTGSVLLLLVFVLFSTKGSAHWWEGLIFIIAYIAYILFMAFLNKPYLNFSAQWRKTDPEIIAAVKLQHMEGGTPETETDESAFTPDTADDTSLPDAESEGKQFLGVELPTSTLGWLTLPLFYPWKFIFRWSVPNCVTHATRWPLTFIMSIIWVMILTFVMTEAAKLSGCFIGIPSSVMGLTVLAAGTSVPDALASVAVARTGHGDMAVSNAIGSNVFDILLGLGLPWFIGGLVKKAPIPITVEPVGFVVIPIAILFAIILLLLAMLPLFGWKLGKPLGVFLLMLYAAFLTYSLLDVFVFKIGSR